ncbi:MAG: hypothetical protein HFH08_01580 [Bacilli bacterium]|nr:hypothetical protein [Bacilli bacterium]
MKKFKFFTIIYVSFVCFLLFPLKGKADPIKSGMDKCVNNNTCLQVCEWNNEGYHAYAYYFLEDKSWKYVWYYQYSPFKAERSSDTLPTKNIFYESSDLKKSFQTTGTCPASAYVDQSGMSWATELCFDSGKIIDDKKKKTYCNKASNAGTDFKGRSSLIYSIHEQIDIYFDKTAIPELSNITCASLADSTGYAVDDSKIQPILDKVAVDFSHNFLYDKELPAWMKVGSYDSNMEIYKNKVNLKVKACNISLREKAEEDLNSGNINQEQYDQVVENGSNAEQNVQDRLDNLDQDINTGNNPSSPTYTPSQPEQDVTEANCNSLLGQKTLNYLKTGLTILQIAGVVLAIILGMGDFIGALLSGEADANKKAFKKFIIRIAMAAALFIIPEVIKFVVSTFGVSQDGMCFL